VDESHTGGGIDLEGLFEVLDGFAKERGVVGLA
jgi:hypothetical protein